MLLRPVLISPVLPRLLLLSVLTVSCVPLSGCSAVLNSLTGNLALNRNPTAPALPGADTVSGTYLGSGKVLLLPTRFRLVLNVNPRVNRADGVLTNLDNSKAYALTGKYVPVSEDGGSVQAEIFQGSRKAGTLVARVSAGELRGTLATLALSYDLTLTKQP